MRKYLETIHQRPVEHKKRFAFVVSAGFTLIIFGIWSLVTFNNPNTVVATGGSQTGAEVTPFESLKSSVAIALKVLRGNVNELDQGLETVNKAYGR